MTRHGLLAPGIASGEIRSHWSPHCWYRMEHVQAGTAAEWLEHHDQSAGAGSESLRAIRDQAGRYTTKRLLAEVPPLLPVEFHACGISCGGLCLSSRGHSRLE